MDCVDIVVVGQPSSSSSSLLHAGGGQGRVHRRRQAVRQRQEYQIPRYIDKGCAAENRNGCQTKISSFSHNMFCCLHMKFCFYTANFFSYVLEVVNGRTRMLMWPERL